MHVNGAIISRPSSLRPSLFGVAELDNVVAEGGLAPGAVHVLEAASARSESGALLHAQAVTAFAIGFGARSGAGACWLGPPPDLLTRHEKPAPSDPDGWLRIDTCWSSRRHPGFATIVPAAPRVLALDARQAYRLAPPVSFARKLSKQGQVVVLLAHDADQAVAQLGAPATCWRIGQIFADAGAGPGRGRRTGAGMGNVADEVAQPGLWRVELVRGDTVRRVVVTACDAAGRMSAAPRELQGRGKEMARRFASTDAGVF